MFSLRFTVILFSILFIPFLLRCRYGESLEIYPAVILPAGAFMIKRNGDSITIGQTVIMGKDLTGSWKEINPASFIEPITLNNFYAMTLLGNFGFNKDTVTYMKSSVFELLRKMNLLKFTQKKGNKELTELNDWIKRRLIKLELRPTVLREVIYSKTLSLKTSEVGKEIIKNENVSFLE